MKTRSTFSHFVRTAVLATVVFCAGAVAQEENDDELFDLNNIIVESELYIWNRLSDVFDIFRCGVAGGGDIGVDIAVTEYAQLGAMVAKERGYDFPHFIPPFWMTHYYSQKKILNFHEGYCATAAIGPWRIEDAVPAKESPLAYFPREKWDLRLEVAVLAHLYVNFSAKETGDFLAGFVGWDPANDDVEQDKSLKGRRKPADQFGRGICNILFGAVEVPSNIIRVTDEEGDMAGASKGLALGVWRFVVREIVGVVEFVTFPFGWDAIIEPEYPIQKTRNAIWRVKRPAFHQRY